MKPLNPYRIVFTTFVFYLLGMDSIYLAAIISTGMEVLYDPLED